MIKRKVRWKVTTSSRQVLRAGGQNFGAFCTACGREVETLNRSQAREILEVGDEELNELLASVRVHAIRTASGSLRICKDSLFSP